MVIILIIVNQKIMNIYPDWMAITVAVYTFYLLFNFQSEWVIKISRAD